VGWANLVWVAVDARGDRAASLTQRLPHPYHYPLTPTRSAGNALYLNYRSLMKLSKAWTGACCEPPKPSLG